MAQWIFVDTATKTPAVRPGQDDPFEDFQDGHDPNGDPYGPTFEYMFVPVVEIAQPVVNPVLQKVEPIFTAGHRGHYVDPNWELGWTTSTQDLPVSKELKRNILQNDYTDAIAAGWTVGQYTFPYSEGFLRLLGSRKVGLTEAISEGLAAANARVTFSDLTGQKVDVTLAQINNNFASYFVDFMQINETEVDAQDDITAAATVAAVNAVEWTF